MHEVLTPLDSLFLHLESPRTPMHMGTIGIFEGGPLTDATGQLRIDELRRRIEERLPLVPKLRRRPSPSPMWLLAPVWQDDPSFDIAMHVRRAALPAPGTEEQLLDVCAEILAWPLSRRRPLWELWFVEGLQGGRVAVVEKLHHALADGLGGVELASVLLDGSRHPARRDAPATAPPEPPPSLASVASRDVVALVERTRLRASAAVSAIRHPALRLSGALRTGEGLASLLRPSMIAPRCSLNRPIGRRRRVAVVRQRIAALRAVERWTGTTLNDVLLTAVAGGMRALHLARGEPCHELQVMVPVGFAHEHHQLGNHVSAMVVRLPLDEPDDVECLRRVAAAVGRSKTRHQARGGAALLESIGVALQPGIGAVAELVQRQPFVNVVVTNVPGPSQSLYSMGARMLEAVPIVPVAANLSIGVAAFSYHGQLTVGLLADRDAVPDLDVLADGMARTFDDLVHRAHAATRVSRAKATPPPRRHAAARAS